MSPSPALPRQILRRRGASDARLLRARETPSIMSSSGRREASALVSLRSWRSLGITAPTAHPMPLTSDPDHTTTSGSPYGAQNVIVERHRVPPGMPQRSPSDISFESGYRSRIGDYEASRVFPWRCGSRICRRVRPVAGPTAEAMVLYLRKALARYKGNRLSSAIPRQIRSENSRPSDLRTDPMATRRRPQSAGIEKSCYSTQRLENCSRLRWIHEDDDREAWRHPYGSLAPHGLGAISLPASERSPALPPRCDAQAAALADAIEGALRTGLAWLGSTLWLGIRGCPGRPELATRGRFQRSF